ncbi:DNA (cytosine-5)-methyltransferase 1 [Paenibacillus sp. yr247]|uniref:DNA cytosine methyltransferase n=1 Tax=Paenibacillus sp. yr247 TaxID=1761880 RepID=UPI000881BB7C|nr:DNA (cytosine-5-)-methyltransferase [Paenibacillus sp. yr247]SDO58162.1 DNA (cytosine-5)-methyltransferase 1 [Paenibacillus sp. yr247]
MQNLEHMFFFERLKVMLKVASFFSGIGGFDLGLERAGMEVVFQCEWNAFCQKVLQKHWPNVKLMGDINDVTIDEIPDAEVWCGGFPCQDVSLANQGKRKGLEGNRSGHFYKYAELIDQRRPEWVIVENVPGLLNSNNGNDFRVVIETLAQLGYGVAWRVLDAKYFGTPQRRRRVYIVASYRNGRAAEVLFEQGPIAIAPRQGLGQREIISAGSGTGLISSNIYSIQHAGIGRKASAGPQAKGYRNDGETYTLDSRGSSDAICKTDAPFGVRKATGVSSGLDGNRFKTLGNAVAVPVIEWIGKRLLAVVNK